MDPHLIRSMIAVSDLKPTTDGAIRAAGLLARRDAAAWFVLHPLGLVGQSPRPIAGTLPSLPRLIDGAEVALRDQLRRCLPDGAPPCIRVLDDCWPPEAVRRQIREVEADLVVMGADPSSDSATAAHGRLIRDVLQTTGTACLVVPGPFRLPIVHAVMVINSVEANADDLLDACRWIAELRRPADASTRLRPVLELELVFLAETPARSYEVAAAMDHMVEVLYTRTCLDEDACVRSRIAWSEPPDRHVRRLARQASADLLVMTPGPLASRQVAMDRFLSLIIAEARCPVLLLPGRSSRRQTGLAAERAPSPVSEPVTLFAKGATP